MKYPFLAILLLTSISSYSQNLKTLIKEVRKNIISEEYEKALPRALIIDSIYRESYDTENAEYSDLISRIGSIYYALKRYDEADLWYKKSVENYREFTDINDEPDYLLTLNDYSTLLLDIHRYAEAEELLSEALAIEKESVGSQSSEYAYSLSQLGYMQYSVGKYSDAITTFKNALDIWKKRGDEKSGDYANTLFYLAEVYYELGQYRLSIPLYTDVARRYKNLWGEKSTEYATILSYMGEMYSEFSDFGNALVYYQKALEIQNRLSGGKGEDYALYTSGVANVYREMGDYNKAEILYKKALAIQDSAGYDNENTLFDLSALYQITGNFSGSEKLCLEVLKKDEKLGTGSIEYIAAENLLANHYTLTGSYDKALELYKRVNEKGKIILGEKNPEYATYLDNLANLYNYMGEYKLSAQVATEALEINKSAYGEINPHVAYSLRTLAYDYKSLGESGKAEEYLKKVIDIYLRTLGPEHYDYAVSLSELADIYQIEGKIALSGEVNRKAADIILSGFGKNHPAYANILSGLAEIQELSGEEDSAELSCIRINANLNNQITENFHFLGEREKEQFISSISRDFDNLNSFVFRRKSANPSITSLSYNNVLALKGIVLQSSKTIRQFVLNSKDTELIRLYSEYFRNKQLLSKINSLTLKERWLNVDSLEAVCLSEEKEINYNIQSLKGFSDLSVIGDHLSWKDVQQALDDKEAAIEFISFRYNNLKNEKDTSVYYCALVVKQGMIQPEMIYLFNESDLISLIQKTKSPNDATTAARLYRMPALSNSPVSGAGNELYELIWKPIEKMFSGIEKIYYSPSGLLNRISFDAIPVDNKSYLSDKYQMIAVTSTRVITMSQNDTLDVKTLSKPVIYGGINYDSDTAIMKSVSSGYVSRTQSQINNLPDGNIKRGGDFSYLEGTLKEAEKISGILSRMNVDPLTISGNEATEESFKALNNLDSPPFIHIATHGFFFPESVKKNSYTTYSMNQINDPFINSANPLLRTGLIFAGGNHAWKNQLIPEGVEDGILMASEVAEMYFPLTKLVVLSACETGLGDIKGAEGVFGLQRAFKMAGVKYLIISLWQVPDYQTAELMGKFYENWLSGIAIHVSFRNAQTYLKLKYPGDPYNWAAFELVE